MIHNREATVTLTMTVDEAISLGAATAAYVPFALPTIAAEVTNPLDLMGALVVSNDMDALNRRIEVALAEAGEYLDDEREAALRPVVEAQCPDDPSGL